MGIIGGTWKAGAGALGGADGVSGTMGPVGGGFELVGGGKVTGLAEVGGDEGVELQEDIGWAGWEIRGSTVYIAISNMLNISLTGLGEPKIAPHLLLGSTLELGEIWAKQALKSGVPSNVIP